MIISSGGKYAVYSEDGQKKLSRWYDTKAEAVKRLQQIEYFKTNKQEIKTTRKEQNPTRQAGRIRKAKADMARRINNALPQVLAMVESFPVKKIQVNQAYYEYDIPPEQLELMLDEITMLLYLELGLNSFNNWFFLDYILPAYQQASMQSYTRLATLSEGVGAVEDNTLNFDQYSYSPNYLKNQQSESTESFNNMKTFATEGASDITRAIITGAAAGASVASLLTSVRQAFRRLTGYKSERLASTEIERVYNNGRFYTQMHFRENINVDVRVVHLSALLLPIGIRTRKSHAQRHGNIYTPLQQRVWWAEGANRINCHCTVLEIIYRNGQPSNKKFILDLRKRKKQILGNT